jgi:hypothetical protein
MVTLRVGHRHPRRTRIAGVRVGSRLTGVTTAGTAAAAHAHRPAVTSALARLRPGRTATALVQRLTSWTEAIRCSSSARLGVNRVWRQCGPAARDRSDYAGQRGCVIRTTTCRGTRARTVVTESQRAHRRVPDPAWWPTFRRASRGGSEVSKRSETAARRCARSGVVVAGFGGPDR